MVGLTLMDLPRELLVKQLGYLAVGDIGSCRCACKGFDAIGDAALASSEHLCFETNGRIDDEILESISGKFPNLKTLSVAGCKAISSIGVLAMLRSCPRLEHISLSCAENLDDKVLCCVASQPFKSLLRTLDLSGGHGLHEFPSPFTDAGIGAVLRSCFNLVKLDLSFCRGISDATLADVCKLPFLRDLSILEDIQFSSQGIAAAFQHLPESMESLDVCAVQMDDDGL